MAVVGAPLYGGGVVLYLWGAKTLGTMFKPASGLGVQLSADQRLVTLGPYAYLRHPMYFALLVVAVGGLLLFWNGTFVFIAANFLTLVMRARREEQALAQQFGAAWRAYAAEVPPWWPRIRCG